MDTAAQGILTRDEMESRRLLAAQDLQGGLTQSQVARKFGVSRTTASRWRRALSVRGVEALRKRRASGRPSRLSAEQLRGAAEIYRAGPRDAADASLSGLLSTISPDMSPSPSTCRKASPAGSRIDHPQNAAHVLLIGHAFQGLLGKLNQP